jgi:hypothetical protein
MAEEGDDDDASYHWTGRTRYDQESECEKKGELLRGDKEKETEIVQDDGSIDVDIEQVRMGQPGQS